MKTINERIKCISEVLFDGNVSAFARQVNVPQPTMKDVVGGKLSSPRFDLLDKIINDKSLNISPEWLMTGEGTMHKNILENSRNLSKQSENDIRISSIDDIINQKIEKAVMENLDKLISTIMEGSNRNSQLQNEHVEKILKMQSDENARKFDTLIDAIREILKDDDRQKFESKLVTLKSKMA